MNVVQLHELKCKLKKLSALLHKEKKKKFYLTNEEKVELLKSGKRIPLRVKGNGKRVKLLVKTRGTIESGELKNKKMGL